MRIFILLFTGPVSLFAQNVEVVSFSELERRLDTRNDTTYVVNFWATWCSPCVEELPLFERLKSEHAGSKLRVILVSLDFKSHIDKKVVPFVKQHRLQSDVWLLDEQDANSYIDKISPRWSGAIPATLIYNGARQVRLFFEKQFQDSELESIVQPILE